MEMISRSSLCSRGVLKCNEKKDLEKKKKKTARRENDGKCCKEKISLMSVSTASTPGTRGRCRHSGHVLISSRSPFILDYFTFNFHQFVKGKIRRWCRSCRGSTSRLRTRTLPLILEVILSHLCFWSTFGQIFNIRSVWSLLQSDVTFTKKKTNQTRM